MDIRVNGQRYRYWQDIPPNVQQALVDGGVFLDGTGQSTPRELLPAIRPSSGTPMPYQLSINGEVYGPQRPVPGLLASVLYSVGPKTGSQTQRRRGPRVPRARAQRGWNISPSEPGPPETWNRPQAKPIVNWIGPRASSGRKQPPPLRTERRATFGGASTQPPGAPMPTTGMARPTGTSQNRSTPTRSAPNRGAQRIKPPAVQPPPSRQARSSGSSIPGSMINKKSDPTGARPQPPPAMTHRQPMRPTRTSARRPRQDGGEITPTLSTTINPRGMASSPKQVAYGSWQSPSPYGGSAQHENQVISEVGQRSTLFMVLGIVAAIILVILLLAITGV